jgi:hypothetical protein
MAVPASELRPVETFKCQGCAMNAPQRGQIKKNVHWNKISVFDILHLQKICTDVNNMKVLRSSCKVSPTFVHFLNNLEIL